MKNIVLRLCASFTLLGIQTASAEQVTPNEPVQLPTVEQVLSQVHACNGTIIIRSQALKQQQVAEACAKLIAQENEFHRIFNTLGRPVESDNNTSLRANFYANRDEFVKYATAHFNMPTDNGGMYLEGFPDKKGNHAEFVAYQKEDRLHNLEHEYVHYLDGRFNRYGDYCSGLHDDHAGPEFCPTPHLAYPHGVWWSEGMAEYLSKGDDNPRAIKLSALQSYPISEIFNTSYNENGGTERVYGWGYLAVRFMMEKHRDKVEQTLILTRKGDWAGYQALVKSWSTSLDDEWFQWLKMLSVK